MTETRKALREATAKIAAALVEWLKAKREQRAIRLRR
jgi:hypothetical protein